MLGRSLPREGRLGVQAARGTTALVHKSQRPVSIVRKAKNSSSKMVPTSTSELLLLREQLVALLKTESLYVVQHIPCQAVGIHTNPARRRPMDLEEWRRKICQWGFRVIDHFRLDREVVSVGMNIFDRFLLRHNNSGASRSLCPCPSCKRMLDSRTYQLAAMTSLYLAIKLHTDNGSDEDGLRRKRFKLDSFVELSRGQFVSEDICEMEQTMLATVCWQVHPPTPMMLVSYMLTTLMPRHESITSRPGYDLVLHVVRELSRYLTELAVCLGREFSGKRPSQVAFAAILASMDLITVSALPIAVRDAFSRRVVAVCGHGSQETIHQTQTSLQKALWPELLFDDCTDPATTDCKRHPISMAREFGLLDVERIYCPVSPSVAAPPTSPKRENGVLFGTPRQHGSPISVTR